MPLVFHRTELNPPRLNTNTGTTGVDPGFYLPLPTAVSVHFVPKFLKWDIPGNSWGLFFPGSRGFDVVLMFFPGFDPVAFDAISLRPLGCQGSQVIKVPLLCTFSGF